MPRRPAAPTSGHRRLVAGARDLERGRAARIGEAAAREERPRHTAATSSREPVVSLFGQPAHRAAAGVEQAGLPGERLAAVEHAHEVLVRAPHP